jgi:predicted dehydrogenase
MTDWTSTQKEIKLKYSNRQREVYMRNINVGIIGYGLSGRIFHGAIIKYVEGFSVKKISSRSPEKIQSAKEDFPDAEVVSSFEDITQDPNIDLVIVSTPNIHHFPIAENALKNNKHVIIEKPFTVTSIEGKLLTKLAIEKQLLISVYQNRRFDSDLLTVKEIIQSNVLGDIVEFESHFDRFRSEIKKNSWREENTPGSGVLFDLGSHLIDQALYLFGIPEEIYCDISHQRNGKVDDNFELIMYYESLKVTLKASSLVKEPLPRFIISGSKGSFQKYGLDIQESDLRSGKRPTYPEWGKEPEELWGVLNTIESRKVYESIPGNYRLYYENVHDAISKGSELIVKAVEAMNVIWIIEKAILSNLEKRRISCYDMKNL